MYAKHTCALSTVNVLSVQRRQLDEAALSNWIKASDDIFVFGGVKNKNEHFKMERFNNLHNLGFRIGSQLVSANF